MLKRFRLGLAGLTAAVTAIALAPAPAAAQDMNAQELYERGKALQQLGARAILTADALIIRNEVEGAVRVANARNDARRQPAYCLPAQGIGLSPKEMLATVEAVPAAERRKMTSAQLMTHVFTRKYPCR